MSDSVQMSFAFFDDLPVEETKKNADVVESEEDALDQLLGRITVPVPSPETGDGVSPQPAETDAVPVEKNNPSAEPETEEPAPEPVIKSKKSVLSKAIMPRAALAFLLTKNPSAAAMNVTTHPSRRKVSAASFTYESLRADELQIARTVLCEASMDPSELLSNPEVQTKLRASLNEKLAEKESLEAMLRETEPQLNESLFSDFSDWHYDRTRNRKYHACLHAIEKLHFALAHAGRLSQLSALQPADAYYLLAPKNTVSASALPEEWGLVEIADDLSMTVVKESRPSSEVPEKARRELAFKIATTAMENVQFANGVGVCDGKAALYALPRKRRKLL